MSLILDALRKLERDKQAPDPAVVVVGPVPWGGADRRRRARALALAVALAASLAAGGFWLLRPGADRTGPGDEGRATPVDEAQEKPAPPAAGPLDEAPPPATASGAQAPVARSTAEADPLAGHGAGPPPPRAIRLPGAGATPTVDADAGHEPPTAAASATSVPSPPGALGADRGPAALAEAAEPEGREPAPAPAGTRELRLTAISERDGRPIALLNDRLVREGDSFDGVRVLRIGATEVEVEIDGSRRVIGF